MYKYLKTLHFESIYSDDSTNFQGKLKNRLVNNFKVDIYRNILSDELQTLQAFQTFNILHNCQADLYIDGNVCINVSTGYVNK